MIETLKTVILFVLMLTIILTIHEFGHFLAAKIFNVYVAEFSIGMGKLIFSKKGKETQFSIRLLPIGGYCAMVGDNENDIERTEYCDETKVPYERTLTGIAKWKKIIILLSGVFMNCVLALVLVAGVYLSIGQAAQMPKPIIGEVAENSAAYKAGIVKDDEIIRATFENGYTIKPSDFAELSDFLSLYEEGEITLNIKRGEEIIEVNVTPTYSEESSSYVLGIKSCEYEIVEINIFNCFKFAASYLSMMFKLLLTTLIGLFRGVNLENVSGPLGMYQATSDAVSYGFSSYILLVALFSLNIGMLNLVPIPALDGGRVVLTFIEAIIRKPISKKIEKIIMTASIVVFMLIFLYATSQDILRLI